MQRTGKEESEAAKRGLGNRSSFLRNPALIVLALFQQTILNVLFSELNKEFYTVTSTGGPKHFVS
jgi:hypothetical protein